MLVFILKGVKIMYPVITISREFGSGGHTIGEQVAKTLDIPFYDGEIVNKVALESGYAKELIEEQGETTSSANKWFDISAASAMYFQSPQDEIFLAQRKVILEAAESGPCVIVGRCSDYILRNAEIPCLNVLIHSDLEHRITRVLQRYGDITNVDVKKRIHKKDKQRRTYYRYYTDQSWGEIGNYDLCVNSAITGVDGAVKTIAGLVRSLEEKG